MIADDVPDRGHCFVGPTLTFERLFAFLVLGWIGSRRYAARRRSGWRDRSPRRFPGHQLPPTWHGTTTILLDMPSGRPLRAMGIRDRPISPRSPWQKSVLVLLTGTVRRECLSRC